MANYKNVGLLHEQLESQAKKTPSRVAIVDVNRPPVTYGEMWRLTEELAGWLQSRGVSENSVVAIYMDKSAQFVLAYLATLRAGGAYLPLDVSYPESLLRDVLMEAEPLVLVTKSGLLPSIKSLVDPDKTALLCLDDLDIPDKRHTPTAPRISLESAAFVVYSSGTTGKPKGIVVPLRAPVHAYLWRHEAYPYVEGEDGETEKEAANVFFVWELMRPLLRGQTLYIVPDDVIYDPPKLLAFLRRHRITRMLFTPSLLETVLEYPVAEVAAGFTSMRQIWLCGEVTTTTLIAKAIAVLPAVTFVNLYSISECHDVATINLSMLYADKLEKLSSTKFTPVGQLLSEVNVAILDSDLKPIPVGVSGEIYVYGPTLATGYLKRPDLNAKRFLVIPHDVAPDTSCHDRMYQTGDWGYLLTDGSLEICGRCDAMVKIRGYSVDTAAVEATLGQLEYVQSCVVVAQGREGEDKRLVAYIVPAASPGPSPRRVRGDLKRRLPFYMIPAFFVVLKEIPILAGTGKLNKNALPTLDPTQHQDQPECMPETGTELGLAEIWTNILQLPAIDVHESFFDLGGHSLLAAKLLQLVNSRFSSELSVRQLYNCPTLAGMARLIDRCSPAPDENVSTLDLNREVDLHSQFSADLDMQLRAFWRFSSFNRTRWSSACVLLTGSTGFLGAFLLAELLRNTESHVFCLIREIGDVCSDGNSAIQERLRLSLRQYHLVEDIQSPNEVSSNPTAEMPTEDDLLQRIQRRVTFVKGDVSLINFGLTDDDYRYLSTEIDYVIHAAAHVNLVYPYSALYSSNVLGTCNVVGFAGTAKVKPLHYISTDAVFDPSSLATAVKETTDLQEVGSRLKDGYSQSKWVAEQIVLRASRQGHPVVVYRLGNQAPDSVNAALNKDDFNFLLVRSLVHLGCCPQEEEDCSAWHLEMTPVDFSAAVVVALASRLQPQHAGKVLHLVNTPEASLSLRSLQNWLQVHGYQCQSVTYLEYLSRLRASPKQWMQRLASLLSEMVPSQLAQTPLHDSTATRQLLLGMGMQYPEMGYSLVTHYFTKFLEHGHIPQPRPHKPSLSLTEDSGMEGKVAVVTGASSGIGEETAMVLARSGCLVALWARRPQRLLHIQQAISALGGKAIAVPTDVTLLQEVQNSVRMVETALGPIDILVNCAGLMYYQRTEELDMEPANSMIDVNIKGVLHCCSSILPGMLRRCSQPRPVASPHIVNVTSDAGVRGFAGLAVYSGTKFFVEGYSQALRQEMLALAEREPRPHGRVRVSCVQPGDVSTPLQTSALTVDPEAAKLFCSASASAAILEPKDVARSILFVLTAPPNVAVNTLLVEPTSAPI